MSEADKSSLHFTFLHGINIIRSPLLDYHITDTPRTDFFIQFHFTHEMLTARSVSAEIFTHFRLAPNRRGN